MPLKKIIIPLANRDFDPSEVAIPWQILRDNGYQVLFATEDGRQGHADPLMLTGQGLDPWGFIPGLNQIRLIGLSLRADANARSAYAKLELDDNFKSPLKYSDLKVEDFAGLILPGGHAKGVRQYLEDKTLLQFVADFFDSVDSDGNHKPIAAVCHGVLVAARAVSEKTGKSCLYGKKTTALTWKLERTAWYLTKYFARFWDGDYYRTYPESKGEPHGYWSTEAEITRLLEKPSDFLNVPKGSEDFFAKDSGLFRDTMENEKPAFVVQDGNYFSGRWPGDVHTMTKRFMAVL